ncbi:MAG: hypothetical protein DRJ37_00325 [Thermoprotei archaeon]|nr:MAG: hypothetical protein DRJ37_00325 [Thermoprotei archaeon]
MNHKPSLWLQLAIFTLIILIAFHVSSLASQPQWEFCDGYTYYIYGEIACPACQGTKKMLTKMCGEEHIVFKEFTANETYMEEYQKLYDLLELGDVYQIPLVVVFKDNTPIIVCVGNYDVETWKEIFQIQKDMEGLVIVDAKGQVKVGMQEELVAKVKEIVLGTAEPTVEKISLGEAFPVVIGAALADSVNPCTFSVFTALLLIAMARGRKIASTGLAFIFAIYAMYFAMGFGLIKIFYYIGLIKYIVAALALVFGSLSILSGLRGFKSPIPMKFREIIESRIEKAVNPFSAAITGVTVSVTLLPCTGGPYLIATAILAKLSSFLEALLLLVIYNLIFVAPLFLILLAIATLSTATRKIKEWRTKKLGLMEVISGILLIAISLYMLFFL